jgi:N-acetylmuramoyl-L-alanine amidase
MEKITKVKSIFVFLFIILSTIVAFSKPQVLQKVTIHQNDLELVFDSDYDKKAIKYFALDNPPRKVFDIPNTILAKGLNRYIKNDKCKAIRVSQYKKDTVRLVIETAKPYHTRTYRPLLNSNIYCIPLPKYKSKSKPKTSTTKLHQKRVKRAKKVIKDSYILPSSKYTKDLIVIDPGHGGHDSGAIGGGKMEKTLVLQIAKKVESELKKLGYRVYLTRRSDRFLKLSQRTKVADRKDAKVFVSIHANSVPRKARNKAYGIETYFLQKTRDAKSQRIAARENAAVLKGAKSKLSKKVIIDSVLNGPKIVESNKLAIDVQRHMIYYLRQHYKGVKDGGVRPAPFYVLVGASRPSVLVEVGYISHYKERKRLFSPTYQRYLAKGIAKGIDRYLKNRKKELGL